jgi:AcrR family transcriptional regulator
VEERFLRAVLEVLAEHGFAGLTLDKVCAWAGAPKATFYRRWSNPTEAAVDALHALQQKVAYKDTGDVAADLLDFARLVVDFFSDPLCGTCRNRLLAEFSGPMNETFLEAGKRFAEVSQATHDTNVALLEAALARQGLAPTLSASLIATTLAALGQQMTMGARVDDAEFPRLIACLLHPGVAAR